MHRMLMGAVAVAALSMISGVAAAQAPPPGPMVTTQIKPGMFVVFDNGGNVTVRVGKDGLIVVDSKNPGEAVHAELMKNIRSVTQLPVKDVIVTHHHADHSGGAAAFKAEGATVIAHEGYDKQIKAGYTGAGNFRPALASVAYTKSYDVKIPGGEARLYHFGPAHTGGDTIVYFPDLKVVAAGDEVVTVTPNVDYPYGASVMGWIDALNQIARLDFDTIVTGHRAVAMSRAQFDDYRKTWSTFVERARASIKAGTSKDRFLASIKTDDLGWNVTGVQWTPPERLDPLYAEMSK